jgi:hypothetical protein
MIGKRLQRQLKNLTVSVCLTLLLFASERESEAPLAVQPPIQTASSRKELWPIQLGLRMARLRSNIATVDRVVLVPDQITFLYAIQQWSLRGRYPILIEDKRYTPLFIKRFHPAEVIRLRSLKHRTLSAAAQRQLMFKAEAHAWNVENSQSLNQLALKQQWQKLGWQPPGVVITSINDPASSAAVALAAAWGQPLMFLEDDFGKPNDSLNPEQWQRLDRSIRKAVADTGFAYSGLGDAIDTVTIARQLAVKYQSVQNPNDQLAVTDGLARNSDGTRWAIAGWIYGSAERSVYQAMCSIFLDAQTALLYDSYPKEGVWLNYDMNGAASDLRRVGLKLKLIEQPLANIASWQKLTKSGLDFDIIFVNSKGDPASFDVGGGQATVKDIPKLLSPAAIHFIHSWSTTTPDDINTVAGKWLDNGAYVYVGSVHEPYLSAFVPPNLIIKRLLASVPFLVSVRIMSPSPWKITTIGDPLMMLTKQRRRLSPKTSPLPKLLPE